MAYPSPPSTDITITESVNDMRATIAHVNNAQLATIRHNPPPSTGWRLRYDGDEWTLSNRADAVALAYAMVSQ